MRAWGSSWGEAWGDSFGASGDAPIPAEAVSSGGGIYWMPPRRRKNRREVYEERVRLGILPKPLPEAVVKAAEKVAEKAKTEQVFEADQPKYQEMLMQELRVTTWLPDYRRAISIAMAIRARERDDEDILLLM